MIRKTSIDVFNQIKKEKLLSKLRLEIYDCLFHLGPLTQMETCRRIGGNHQDRSYMPRFAELKELGVIEEVGEKECSVTGRTVLLWDVTDQLPKQITKKEKRTFYLVLDNSLWFDSGDHKVFSTALDAENFMERYKGREIIQVRET